LDLVWDDYRKHSLKQQTRKKRGKGYRRRVEANSAVPKTWQEFLKLDENKREFFDYLSHEVTSIDTTQQVVDVIFLQPRSSEGLAHVLMKKLKRE